MRGGLLKNECIKTWRQRSMKVLMIILAAIFVLAPLAVFAVEKLLFQQDTPEKNQQNYLNNAEWAAQYMNEDMYYKIYYEYYICQAEAIDFFIDNGIANTWKYDMFFGSYNNLFVGYTAYRLMAEEGYSYEDVMNYGYFYDLKVYYTEPGAEDDDEKWAGGKDGSYKLSDAEIKACYDELSAQLAQMKNEILEADFSGILKQRAEHQRDMYNQALYEVEHYRDILNKSPGSEEAKYDYDLALLNSECMEALLARYEYLCDIGATPDSWEYVTVVNYLDNVLKTKGASLLMPETLYNELYNSNSLNRYYESYGEYKSQTESEIAKAGEALAILNYSLDNDIPTPQALETSTKLKWQNDILTALGYVRIFMIILAGTIVAYEYSSGSIRLLVIRPKKRSKILTSKLLCVGVWTLLLMAAAMLIMLVLNVVLYGFGDIFIPDIVYAGGRVFIIPGFLSALYNLAVCSLPAIFMASVAFLLSVLTKKSALSIALPLIINSIGAAVSAVALMLVGMYPWLGYTILPYSDMSMFTASVLDNFYYDTSFSISNIFGGGIYTNLNVLIAAVIVLLHTALMVFLSYLAFIKQQVKN